MTLYRQQPEGIIKASPPPPVLPPLDPRVRLGILAFVRFLQIFAGACKKFAEELEKAVL